MSEQLKPTDCNGQEIAANDWIKTLEDLFAMQASPKRRIKIRKGTFLKVDSIDEIYELPLIKLRDALWAIESTEKTQRLLRYASVLDVNAYHQRWVEVEFEHQGKILISKGFLESLNDDDLRITDYDPTQVTDHRTESSTHTIPIAMVKGIKGQPAGPVEYLDPVYPV